MLRSRCWFRELLAIKKTLLQFQHDQVADRNILWLTDSENVVSFLHKGSHKPHIQKLVFECLVLARGINCNLEPLHLLREDPRIQMADTGSKVRDTDNWSIDQLTFDSFDNDFGFDIDLFADANNKRVPRYVSKFYDEHAVATDAFSIPWVGMCWICPPASALIRIARRITSSKCQGLVIVPNWPASQFFNCFFTHDNTPRPPFRFIKEFRPFIIQNEQASQTPLLGYTLFSFFALYFDTS